MGWYAGYVEELLAFPKPMDAEQVGREGREGGREGGEGGREGGMKTWKSCWFPPARWTRSRWGGREGGKKRRS